MTTPRKQLPSQERLSEILYYDGELRWVHTNRTKKAGAIAGSISKQGYRRTKVDGQFYYVHRLVWKLVKGQEPPETIDHINGNKLDNRIENLQELDCRSNLLKARSGKLLPGVQRLASGKYSARATVNCKTRHLGVYNTELEAHQAYVKAF